MADTKGTAHLFGISGGVSVITNATVQSFTRSKSKQNQVNTYDEIGNEIERRNDDALEEVSLSLRIQAGYTIPEPHSLLAYGGTTYEILTVEEGETNQAHIVVSITAKTSEFVALA